jgi:hypothetical protein
MFVCPVTNREAKHVDNPFMMPMGIKTAAALKKRDALADLLLKVDYTFLTKEGAPKPVTAEDVRTRRPAAHEQPRQGDRARPLGQPRCRSSHRRRGRRIARAAQPGKGDGVGRLRGRRGRAEERGVSAVISD